MNTFPFEYPHCLVIDTHGIIIDIQDIPAVGLSASHPFFFDQSTENLDPWQGSGDWYCIRTFDNQVTLWKFQLKDSSHWVGSLHRIPSWWAQMREIKEISLELPMLAWEKINWWFSKWYPVSWSCRKDDFYFQKSITTAYSLDSWETGGFTFSFFSNLTFYPSSDLKFFLQVFTDILAPLYRQLSKLNEVFFSIQLDSDYRIIQVSANWQEYWGSDLVYQIFPNFIDSNNSINWKNGGVFNLNILPNHSISFLLHPAQKTEKGNLKVLLQTHHFHILNQPQELNSFQYICSEQGKLIWANEKAQAELVPLDPLVPIWSQLPPDSHQIYLKELMQLAKVHPNRMFHYQWPVKKEGNPDQLLVWQLKFISALQHWELFGNYQEPIGDIIPSWQVFNEVYQPIFVSNTHPMWIYEPGTWRIVDVNQAACEQYQYTRDEFRQLTLVDIRPPDQIANLFGSTQKFYPQGQTDFGVFVHQKKNGNLFKTRISGFPIRYDQKTFIFATGNPIMEEAVEKYSLALKMSEKKLQSAAQIAKLGYWEINLTTFELTWSREMYEVYDVKPTEFYPSHLSFLSLLNPKDLDHVHEVWKGIEQGKTEFDLIFQTISPNGKIRWIQDRSQYEFNPITQEKWLRGTSQDVTEQKAEALKLALFEKIVGSVQEAILIIKSDSLSQFKATYCNASFVELTGCHCDDFEGLNPLDWYWQNWTEAQRQDIERCILEQKPAQVTFLQAKKNEEVYWSQLSFLPVLEERNAEVFWVLTDRDITKQKNEALQWKMGAEISRFFSQAETLQDALIDSLDYISDLGRFEIAEFWFLDQSTQKLYLKAHIGRGEVGQAFYSHSSLVFKFGKGEGLPGQVWKKMQIEFWKIGHESENFTRRRAAQQAGLREVWGIPIQHQTRMIGVLVVGRGVNTGFMEFTYQVLAQMDWLFGAEITRKQMETQLLELFNFSPDLLGILGPTGFIRNINPAFTQTLGYSYEELVGKELDFILDSTQELKNWLDQSTGQNPGIIAKSVTKTGEEKWIAWTRSYTGEPEEYRFIYGRDITSQIQAKHELEKKTQQLNVLAEINSSLLQESNWMEPMYKGMKWMAQVTQVDRVSFYSLQQTKAHLQLEWCNPNTPKRYNTGNWISENLEEYPKLLIKLHHGNVITHQDGPHEGNLFSAQSYLILPILVNSKAWGFWIFENLKDVHEWDLEEYAFLGTLGKNFTKAIESQHHKGILVETLREKEMILQSISDGFLVIDDQFRWQYFNRTAEKLLQIESANWKGKSVVSSLPFTPDPQLVQEVMGTVKTQKTSSFEIFYPPTQLWFDVKIYPSSGGLTVYFQDITERKEQQETLSKMNASLAKSIHELRILNDELEQFAFIASHDLQEPLRMITSFLQQLDRRYGNRLDDRAKQYIQFASDGARRMRQIISDLLQYSRVGKQLENVEELDFVELLEDYRLLRKKLIHENNVQLTLRNATKIRFYKSPLVQVLHCLLDNAIRYVAAGVSPEIDLWVEDTNNVWVVNIQDNGIGIDPIYFEKIFIMFQRLHDRETYEGTGMGLAIVKKQVESWGGQVFVSSTPGNGSVFQFSVPKLNSYES